MIDPFDAALSEFIDSLPDDQSSAQHLLEASAPFTGQGDLPALAELATVLRSVPPYEPRPEWVLASRARLMAAPLLSPEKRGLTWLGSMFLPLTQLSLPSFSLPQLGMPSPAFARATVALALIASLASVAHDRAGQNPILQLTTDQAPVENAEQAITSAQQEMARLAYQGQVAGVEVKGSPRDIVLLSKQFELAELAIDKAPPADQPRLRTQLQGTVRAVRFDGLLEGVTNGSTLQVSGVAIQSDGSTAQQLTVGQQVSLLVSVGSGGKLQALQVTPAPVAQPSQPPTSPGPASSDAAPPSAAAPPPAAGGGTAPLTSSKDSGTVAGASPATASLSQADRGAARGNTAASASRQASDGDRATSATASSANATTSPSAGAAASNSPAAGSAASASAPSSDAAKSDKSDKGSTASSPASSAVAGATASQPSSAGNTNSQGSTSTASNSSGASSGSSNSQARGNGGQGSSTAAGNSQSSSSSGNSQSSSSSGNSGAAPSQGASNSQGQQGSDNSRSQSNARALQVRDTTVATSASSAASQGADKTKQDKAKDQKKG